MYFILYIKDVTVMVMSRGTCQQRDHFLKTGCKRSQDQNVDKMGVISSSELLAVKSQMAVQK